MDNFFEENSDPFTMEANDIGSKLQNYYVALRSGNLSNILLYLSLLENHIQLTETIDQTNVENSEVVVVSEIVLSCREKTAQYYRQNCCNEYLNTLIVNIRKKLMMKVATSTSSEASTNAVTNHHQRHLVCLIDLLGSFSNLIMEFQAIQISLPTQIMIVVPIHNTRIKDCIKEIYKNFKNDKNLEAVQENILNMQQQKAPTSNNGKSAPITAVVNITITSLDSLLVEISSFSQTISRYYTFLHNMLLQPFFYFEHSRSSLPSAGASSINSSVISIYYPPELKQQMSSICGEMSSSSSIYLRELDAFFISFEYKYLTLAVAEAFKCTNLLHIERQVYIPQNVEDVFFLVHKVSERSIMLQNDSVLFAIGNKVIEMFDPSSASLELDSIHVNDDGLNVYHLLAHKLGFHLCTKKQRIQLPRGHTAVVNNDNTVTSRMVPSSTVQTPPASQLGAPRKQQSGGSLSQSQSASETKASKSSSSSALNLGLGAWLVEALTNELDEENDNYMSNLGSSGHNKAPRSGSSLFSGFAAAFDDDESAVTSQQQLLQTTDMCVYVSTLATCVLSVKSLAALYQRAIAADAQSQPSTVSPSQRQSLDSNTRKGTSSSSGGTSSTSLVIQEMKRCAETYQKLFQIELEMLCDNLFESQFVPQIKAFVDSPFNIDGETMDKRMAEEKLSSFFKTQLLGSSSSAVAESPDTNTVGGLQYIKERLTSYSYTYLIQLLADRTVTVLFDCCVKASYSEWGAILMQNEIRQIISYFDQSYVVLTPAAAVVEGAGALMDTFSIRQVFSPLQWLGTFITLDQPGNIRRYTVPLRWALQQLPSSQPRQHPHAHDINDVCNNGGNEKDSKAQIALDSESLIKLLLSCRVDLSSDAIQKIKITFQ